MSFRSKSRAQELISINIIIMSATVERKTLVQCENCYVHRACLGTLKLLTFGELKLEMLEDQASSILITVKDFYYFIQKQQIFVKYEGKNIITYYLIDGDRGLYAFSLGKSNVQIINLEKNLQLTKSKIIDVKDISSYLKYENWIQQHRPSYKSEDIVSNSAINTFIGKSGNFINKKLQTLQSKAVTGIKNKADSMIASTGKNRQICIQEQEKEDTGSFGKVKKVVSLAYQKSQWAISSLFDPLIGGIHKVTHKLSQKIDKSNSNFLKRTKQFWNVSQLSIRNGVQGIQNIITGIGTQVYNQGKEIYKIKMRSQPAIATQSNLSQTNAHLNAEVTDMPLNGQKNEQTFSNAENKKQELQIGGNIGQIQINDKIVKEQEQIRFPKLDELSIRTDRGVEVQKEGENQQSKVQKLKLDQLSQDQSVEEQS